MLVHAVLLLAVMGEPGGGASGPAERPPGPPGAAPAQAREDTPVSGVVIIAPPKAPEVPKWADRLDFDPTGRFKQSETPYLRRRPVDGCKLMAGGSVSPTGVQGVAAGPVCSFRF